MKVVIDIDEELVCEGFERRFTKEERDILIRAIGNGIPLPKGHGDLIDRDKIKPLMDEYFMDTNMLHYDDLTNAEHFNLGIENCLNEIDEMEPVIKADK